MQSNKSYFSEVIAYKAKKQNYLEVIPENDENKEKDERTDS